MLNIKCHAAELVKGVCDICVLLMFCLLLFVSLIAAILLVNKVAHCTAEDNLEQYLCCSSTGPKTYGIFVDSVITFISHLDHT